MTAAGKAVRALNDMADIADLPKPKVPTWLEQAAVALEARADHCMAAVVALDSLDGMFTERGELLSAVEAARKLLGLEEDNLRKRAERVRGGS